MLYVYWIPVVLFVVPVNTLLMHTFVKWRRMYREGGKMRVELIKHSLKDYKEAPLCGRVWELRQ
jgi:hypothetical protein